MNSLSRTFSKFVGSLNYECLPPGVVDKIKASLLHALIISIVGASTRQGRATIDFVKELEAKSDGMTILVDGSRATCFGAAFANSMLLRDTDQVDSYRMLIHPGCCVIPAGLAVAEWCGKSGKDLLCALVAGYEVETRIASDFIPSTQARGFRASPVYGTLGAAVTAGKLLGLTEDQLVTAIALACSFAGGTNEGPRSGGRERIFHEPNATRNGIMAALLARGSLRGSEAALEGDAGFYNAFVGNNRGKLSYAFMGQKQASLDAVGTELGTRWELMHIMLKIYPTTGYNCPVIDLMAQLRARYDMPAADITEIEIDMNWLETLYPSPAFPRPEFNTPGIGSTHYYAAYTCIYGSYPPLKPRVEAGEKSSGEAPEVMDLLGRVRIVGHQNRPAFAPRITVRMRDGATYQNELRGDEMEWDLDTETRQIRTLFDHLPWEKDKLEAIIKSVAELEHFSQVDSLIQSCVKE